MSSSGAPSEQTAREKDDEEVITSDERQTVVQLFNSADSCIQTKCLAVMRLTVNQGNVQQFVNDMISRTLRNLQRSSSRAGASSHQDAKTSLSPIDLAICAAVMQVCVQGGDYRYLMTAAADQDERLTWFVKDVLFPLAHILQIRQPLALAAHKRTI